MSLFKKEILIVIDRDESIVLAALLGDAWPCKPYMAELAQRTPSTL